MSKLEKTYKPTPDSEFEEPNAFKLSLSIGPSGMMSLKPVEENPVSMEEVVEEVTPAPMKDESYIDKWGRWVTKFTRKLCKKGALTDNIMGFSFSRLEELLTEKNPDLVKDYFLPILSNLQKPARPLKRWNKKWEDLQQKTSSVTVIRLGAPESSLVAMPNPFNEPQVVEKMEVHEFEEPVQEENNTVKIQLNEEDFKYAVGAVSEPYEEPEQCEETKVVIQNFPLIRSLAAERQWKGPTKSVKPKGTMSVVLPSLDSIQKISSVVFASEQIQTDPALKEAHSQFGAFPIDPNTKENIRKYILDAWGAIKREIGGDRNIVPKERRSIKKEPSVLIRMELDQTMSEEEKFRLGDVMMKINSE